MGQTEDMLRVRIAAHPFAGLIIDVLRSWANTVCTFCTV